jgi:hypothetical protein
MAGSTRLNLWYHLKAHFMMDNMETIDISSGAGAATIELITDPGILALSWKYPTSSPVIQQVYEALLHQMQRHQVKHVLVDTRQRGRATDQDEVWMMRQFAPRLIQYFNDGIYLAYLLKPAHYFELQTESPNGSMESLSQLFSMNYFLDTAAAIAWLKQKKYSLQP